MGIWILYQPNTQTRKDRSGFGNYVTIVHGQRILPFWKTGWKRNAMYMSLQGKHHGLKKFFLPGIIFLTNIYWEVGERKREKKLFSFPEEFLSISKERVDSGRQKSTSPLLPWERTLPKKWENPLPRHHLQENQPRMLSLLCPLSVFHKKCLSNLWTDFKISEQNKTKQKTPSPSSLSLSWFI